MKTYEAMLLVEPTIAAKEWARVPEEVEQGGTVLIGQFGIGEEGEMQDAAGRFDGRERTRVHFAQDGAAQWMRFKAHFTSYSSRRKSVSPTTCRGA